jgi:lipopolysaccharide transport system ATP-binding protein
VLIDHGEILLDGPPKMVTMYYQKMLYSSEKDYPAVAEEIRILNCNETRKNNFEEYFSEVGEEAEAEAKFSVGAERKKMDLTEEVIKPYYLPLFISKTAVEYRNFDIYITDVGIFTASGLKVNVLVHGETYSLRYNILINETVNNLQFSNSIKTEKGQDISWFVYPAKSKFEEKQYKKGDVLSYSMNFDCLLLAGANYYVNVGLRSLVNGESIIAHRIVDVYLFKVISQNVTNGGIVSLNQKVIV